MRVLDTIAIGTAGLLVARVNGANDVSKGIAIVTLPVAALLGAAIFLLLRGALWPT